jgi:hypothetical protein
MTTYNQILTLNLTVNTLSSNNSKKFELVKYRCRMTTDFLRLFKGRSTLKIATHKTIVMLLSLLIASISNASYLEPGLHQHAGLEGYYYRYNEKSAFTNSFLMRTKGQMFGVYYAAEFQPENKPFYFSAEGRIAWGYKINYSSNGTGDLKNDENNSFEGRLLGSYCIPLESQSHAEGYIGLGIRSLYNPANKNPTTTGAYSYFRRSTYNYIPIGLRIVGVLSNDVKCIGHLEYDWIIRANQKSYLYHIMLQHKQRRGYGVRTGIDFHIPSSQYNLSYTLGIFARYWNMKKSDTITLVAPTVQIDTWEPKNSTQEYGIRLGLLF